MKNSAFKKTLSIFCAACVIAGLSSCTEENAPASSSDTTAVSSETTTTALESVTTVSETTVVSETTEAETSKTSVTTDITANPTTETSSAEEQSTPSYEPPAEEAFIRLETTEIYNDTEKITFSIGCREDVTLETDASFDFQVLTDGQWETIEPLAPYGTEKITIDANSPLVINLYPADYGIALETLREYRISKTIGGKEYETFFIVGGHIPPLEKSNIKLTIKEGSSFKIGDKGLTLNYEYIGGADYAEYGFGCEYSLEKLKDGKWETVEFSENAAFIELGYLISAEYPNNSTTVTFNDSFYAEPLTAGTYKIIKPIQGDVTLTALFRLNDRYNLEPEASEGDIEMTLSDTEIAAGTESLTLNFKYTGNYDFAEFGFGSYYYLEKSVDGEWKKINFAENVGFDDLAYFIGTEYPENTLTVSLADFMYKEPLTKGKYRIAKPINIVDDSLMLTAEFEITDKKSSYVRIESENGTITLTIDEITKDGFICTHPWPSPRVYTVKYEDKHLSEKFCIGDMIDVDYSVTYQDISENEDFKFIVVAENIRESEFEPDENVAYKPVIYLYPEKETEVEVELIYNGRLTVTYPVYKNGWKRKGNARRNAF